jgi:hypothetical protein
MLNHKVPKKHDQVRTCCSTRCTLYSRYRRVLSTYVLSASYFKLYTAYVRHARGDKWAGSSNVQWRSPIIETYQISKQRMSNDISAALTAAYLKIGFIVLLLHVSAPFDSSRVSWNDGKKRAGKSTLSVSEVHIPAYRKTKLPFILNTVGDRNYESNFITVKREEAALELSPPLIERTYRDVDSASMIPYLDGHLVHKTCQPVFTPEECQMIIDEAETICNQFGWTTTRHGNFP